MRVLLFGMLNVLTTYSPAMIVFWVFGLGLLLQLFYMLFYFLRLARYKKGAAAENLPPVSVIICARNEDDNLTQNLPLILAQDYPDFEVVVVNDCSYDLTGD